MDSPKICHCRILTRMQQYVKKRENPQRFVGEQRESPMICHCYFLKRMRQYVENKENPLRFVSLVSNRECNNTSEQKDSP